MAIAQHTSLFVFGTLLDEDVLRIVLGRKLPLDCRRIARLSGYERQMLHDETYPVLVPAPGREVAGKVLTLSGRDMHRVMFFEADEYVLEAAQVFDANGCPLKVVLCAERAKRTGPRYPWSLQRWQREHKATFLEQAASYMGLLGTMDTAQANGLWKSLGGRE